MDIRFNFQEAEPRWIKIWDSQKLGIPSLIEKTSGRLVMVIPPPNITGILHLGHAIDNVLPDYLVRCAIMEGQEALRVPGTDHAGIATQYVVKKNLRNQGMDTAKISREEFLKHIQEWAQKSKGEILEQLVKLGCLFDFSRTRFTMDEICSRAVRHAFKKLFDEGLIYQGDRMINWCPGCRSALSDLEVEWEAKSGKIWQVKYPITDGDSLVVATTRPETMLGDAAVAVHPDDLRYKNFIGRKAMLPLMNRKIPIVADPRVDPAFGTGAVKVTPGHDPLDWAIGQDHRLPIYLVIGENGLMTEAAGPYARLKIAEARAKVLEDLAGLDLLVKEEPYTHNVGTCCRCSQIVEPLVSKQWFLKMESLRDQALAAYQREEPRFYPAHWGGIYFRWLEGLKDWCLSRQIIWGHRIPVWHCERREMRDERRGATDSASTHLSSLIPHPCPPIAAEETPKQCPQCGNENLVQDPDVLDTWFSSGLWPMSVFGWPQETQDFERFYPTSLLVTGYDITYLWVSRMIMFGLYFTGKVPFEKVYLHGLIRDSQGRKMSKTLGNVVDPREIQKEYGTDALRFALLTGAYPGRDISIGRDQFTGAKNFVTKIWNAARFIQLEAQKIPPPSSILHPPSLLHPSDAWILNEINELIQEVRTCAAEMDAAKALRRTYDSFWSLFCGWYIEIAKYRLAAWPEKTIGILVHSLDAYLKLLQPALPFVTQEIAGQLKDLLPEGNGLLAHRPLPHSFPLNPQKIAEAKRWWKVFSGIVNEIRSLRADMRIAAQETASIAFRYAEDSAEGEGPTPEDAELIEKLSNCKIEATLASALTVRRPASGTAVEIVLGLRKDWDRDAETKKISQEIELVQNAVARLEANLARTDFTSKAPAEVIEKEKGRLTDLVQRMAKLKDYLHQLNK